VRIFIRLMSKSGAAANDSTFRKIAKNKAVAIAVTGRGIAIASAPETEIIGGSTSTMNSRMTMS